MMFESRQLQLTERCKLRQIKGADNYYFFDVLSLTMSTEPNDLLFHTVLQL